MKLMMFWNYVNGAFLFKWPLVHHIILASNLEKDGFDGWTVK